MKKYNFSHFQLFFNQNRRIFLLLILCLSSAMLFAQESPAAAESPQAKASPEQGISLTGDQAKMPIGGGEEESEAGEEAVAPELSAPGLSAWNFILMFIVLALVIAAIWGLSKLLKRLAGNNFAGSEIMKLNGTLSLSGNRFLHLVEVGNQLFLVGASDNSVELVAEITDQETIDQVRLKGSAEAAGSGSFMQRLLGRMQSKGPVSKTANPNLQGQTLDFMNKQKERLKKL